MYLFKNSLLYNKLLYEEKYHEISVFLLEISNRVTFLQILTYPEDNFFLH